MIVKEAEQKALADQALADFAAPALRNVAGLPIGEIRFARDHLNL